MEYIFENLSVTRSDFLVLMRMSDSEKLSPNLIVKEDGVYVAPLPDTLVGDEIKVWNEHPTGRTLEPIFTFPVRLEKLIELDYILDFLGRLHNVQFGQWVAEKVAARTTIGSTHSHFESRKLRVANSAYMKFWHKVDLENSEIYPDTREIVCYFMDEGFSEPTAEELASVIRPDGAKRGRRSK